MKITLLYLLQPDPVAAKDFVYASVATKTVSFIRHGYFHTPSNRRRSTICVNLLYIRFVSIQQCASVIVGVDTVYVENGCSNERARDVNVRSEFRESTTTQRIRIRYCIWNIFVSVQTRVCVCLFFFSNTFLHTASDIIYDLRRSV